MGLSKSPRIAISELGAIHGGGPLISGPYVLPSLPKRAAGLLPTMAHFAGLHVKKYVRHETWLNVQLNVFPQKES